MRVEQSRSDASSHPQIPKLKSIELFAGAGGLGLGLHSAGFKPEAVIERDTYCCDTIRENKKRNTPGVRHWQLVSGDVRDVKFSLFADKVDIVSGGPPCQPFSVGGKHRAHQDTRDMFPQAIRAVREIRPKAFIFENVRGLTRERFRNYYEYIKLQMRHPEVVKRDGEEWVEHLSRLERHHTATSFGCGLQYNVVARVLNAANYGVPQKRYRVFFVGFRNDLNIEWNFPAETHSEEALLWDQEFGDYWLRHEVSPGQVTLSRRVLGKANAGLFPPMLKPWRTVRDAIAGMPDPARGRAEQIPNHRLQAGARSYPGHTGSPIDAPAKALKAGVHGVPGGENMLVRPNGSIRYFSVREAARLQTFPDEFVFHGSWSETMRQLGNAVPVRLAASVGKSVAQQLALATTAGVIQ